MMYRRLRDGSNVSDDDIKRITSRRQRAKEPKNGGLTVAQFFQSIKGEESSPSIVGTLEIQQDKDGAAK